MSYINVVIALSDFFPYINEILTKNEASLYIEIKNKDKHISKVKVTEVNFDSVIKKSRDKNLNFFITTLQLNDGNFSFYDDEICKYTIEGTGGRTTDDIIERISLRLISKTPDSRIKKIFNAIKNKLKKDEKIDIGVKGGSAMHRNYFYQKDQVKNKTFVTDMFNDKAPIIEVAN